ncbi:MAG: hypothetical protein IRY95_00640, partial [Clostridia bacterium]|nr:hypothetical protein [Clostridia bacterium]
MAKEAVGMVTRFSRTVRTVFLLALLAGSGLAGCTGGGPAQRPAPDRAEIRAIVRDELQSPRIAEQIRAEVRKEGIQPLVDETLRSPATERQVARLLQEQMESPDFQKRLQDVLMRVMQSPQAQQSLQQMVRSSLMQVIQGGAG